MPLLAWSQAKTSFRYVQRARSRCRPLTVEGTRGGAAIPATPLQDFARHCYTNLVRNIIIQIVFQASTAPSVRLGAMLSLLR
jgi:hypothetical protein